MGCILSLDLILCPRIFDQLFFERLLCSAKRENSWIGPQQVQFLSFEVKIIQNIRNLNACHEYLILLYFPQITVGELTPGDCIGEVLLLSNTETQPYTVTTSTATTLGCLPISIIKGAKCHTSVHHFSASVDPTSRLQ